MDGSYTFRLFRNNQSFLQGMASILDFSSSESKYNYNKNETSADCESIRADWQAIGGDMQAAINEYEQEQAPANL
jgi:hypothetical protein